MHYRRKAFSIVLPRDLCSLRKKEAIIDYLGSSKRLGVDIYYRVQEEPKGSADAVYHGRDFVGKEDFVVIFGDNYFKPYDTVKNVIKFHADKKPDATLLLHPADDPTRFGVARINERNEILSIIEKPTLEQAKVYRVDEGYLTLAGLVVLGERIFGSIEKTEPGLNGEVWLSDSIERLREQSNRVCGCVFKGNRFDIGTFESLKEADKIEQEKDVS